MTRRRLPRADAASLDGQVLLSGEIAYDTDNAVPLFGDGLTVGGRRARGRERWHIFDVIPARHHTAILNYSTAVDVSAWLQDALDEPGLDLELCGLLYASGVTQSQAGQRIFAHGRVQLKKSANGVVLTLNGSNVEMNGIEVRGDAATPVFTGDNIVATGVETSFINCSSRWAAGRALKATGNAVMIMGRRGIWQTADQTATGYDIEIGQTGLATLYHVIQGYRSSQATGGIKLVGVGAASLTDGQFGKLTIDAGGNPAGSNGGMTSNCRILGNVSVGLSGAAFACNQFGDITLTLEAGTSGCDLGVSNTFGNGFQLVNLGNGAQSLVRSVGTAGQIIHRYGRDAAYCDLGVNGATGFYTPQSFRVGNNKAFSARNAADTADLSLAIANASNNSTFGHATAGTNTVLQSGSGGVYLNTDAGSIMQVTGTAFRPVGDNTINLGGTANRLKEIFSANAVINTSDESLKRDIAPIDDAVLDAWATVDFVQYRWIDSVEAKATAARVHYGLIAQRLVAAFETHGLDPWSQGLLCRDAWEEHELLDRVEYVPAVLDEAGEVIEEARSIDHYRTVPAGTRMGVRYEQALVLEAALMRRTAKRLTAALEGFENATMAGAVR